MANNPTYYETEEYAFNLHHVGALITRKRDNTSVYFQPSDATQDAIEVVSNCLAPDRPELIFNGWCSDFSEMFDNHAGA